MSLPKLNETTSIETLWIDLLEIAFNKLTGAYNDEEYINSKKNIPADKLLIAHLELLIETFTNYCSSIQINNENEIFINALKKTISEFETIIKNIKTIDCNNLTIDDLLDDTNGKSIWTTMLEEALRPTSTYFPMLHGKATDAIARMAGSKPTPNPLNKTASIESGEVKLVINQLDKLSGTLGVSTHKLLSTAIARFTALNHTGTGNDRSLREAKVSIPLKDYAIHCGYDVEKHPTLTPEETEKEALRAKRTLDNFRRKVKKDLELLYNASISWKEKIKGKEKDFAEIRILGGMGIRAGYINLEFTVSLAEYLIQLPLSQYPQSLLLLDERNDNAYNIGLKMAEHYSNDNNQIKGTAQLLKVKTLLDYTSLPTIITIRKQRTSWEARIKEPFENALDALVACGLLEDWRYSHSKGKEMTNEEATNFKDFDEWTENLVYFTLKDAPNHTPRIEAKAEETKIQHNKAKTKRTSKKNKTTDKTTLSGQS